MTQSFQMEALMALFDLSNSEWLIIVPAAWSGGEEAWPSSSG